MINRLTHFIQISKTSISLKEKNKHNRKCHERTDIQLIPYINGIFYKIQLVLGMTMTKGISYQFQVLYQVENQ